MKSQNLLQYKRIEQIFNVCKFRQKIPFHITNFKNNNINIKHNSIKYCLQKFREINFPSDKNFKSDITKIVITLDETNINLTNIYTFLL